MSNSGYFLTRISPYVIKNSVERARTAVLEASVTPFSSLKERLSRGIFMRIWREQSKEMDLSDDAETGLNGDRFLASCLDINLLLFTSFSELEILL